MKKLIVLLVSFLVLSCGKSTPKQPSFTNNDEIEYMEFESMTDPNFFDYDFNKISEEEAKEKAIEIIKKFEGFSPTRYKCPSGKTTIGYGLTSKYLKGRHKISKLEAHNELLKVYDEIINELDYGDTKLTEAQKASLVSLGFNIGITRLNESTLMKEIRKGNIKPNLITQFVYAKNKKGVHVKLDGLVKRRTAEYELFFM